MRIIPDRFTTGNGKTWERDFLSLNLQTLSRDDIKGIAKFLQGYWNAEEISRTWLGQEATKAQMLEFIETGWIKTPVTVEPVMPSPNSVQVAQETVKRWQEPVDNHVHGSNGASNGSNGNCNPMASNAAVVAKLRDALSALGIETKKDDQRDIEEIKAELLVALRDAQALMERHLNGKLEEFETRFQEISQSAVQRTEVIVKLPNGVETVVKGQHKMFPKLLKRLAMRRCVYIVGPAGSGKSEAIKKAADTLGMSYADISCCRQTMAFAFLGFHNANGEYVRTAFRDAYEHGGVFNADELDKMNENTAAVLNSGITGKGMSFPDDWIPKSPDFVFGGTANTIGEGSSRQYVGSVQLDAATLDRFAFMEWGYDEQFEMEICVGRFGEEVRHWVRRVQEYRRNVARSEGLKVVISPRASIYGSEDLASGEFTIEECEYAYIFKGRDEATCTKIRGEVV